MNMRKIRVILNPMVGCKAVLANGPYTGLGFTVAPEAWLDDGVFDFRVFCRLARWTPVRRCEAITFGRWSAERPRSPIAGHHRRLTLLIVVQTLPGGYLLTGLLIDWVD